MLQDSAVEEQGINVNYQGEDNSGRRLASGRHLETNSTNSSSNSSSSNSTNVTTGENSTANSDTPVVIYLRRDTNLTKSTEPTMRVVELQSFTEMVNDTEVTQQRYVQTSPLSGIQQAKFSPLYDEVGKKYKNGDYDGHSICTKRYTLLYVTNLYGVDQSVA
jgi:hypothetical protein